MWHHDLSERHHAVRPRPGDRSLELLVVFLLFVLSIFTGACSLTREPSRTPRTVVEQLLLTHATERSLAELSVPLPEGANVLVEVTGLTRLASYIGQADNTNQTVLSQAGQLYGPSTDLAYVKEVVAGRLGELGFRIRDKEDQADYIVKTIVQSLGTEQGENFFGMPPVQSVLLPFSLPELTLYKLQHQEAHMRFSLDLYERRTGRFLRSTPVYTGTAFYKLYTLLFFFSFRTTDLISPP
jgi:hypothetical protein